MKHSPFTAFRNLVFIIGVGSLFLNVASINAKYETRSADTALIAKSERILIYPGTFTKDALKDLWIDKDNKRRGWYYPNFRVDRNYEKVTMRWSRIVGYSRTTKTFKDQIQMPKLKKVMSNVRKHPDPEHFYFFELNLINLEDGTYRVVLIGQDQQPQRRVNNVHVRLFEFKNASFSELP